MDLYQITEITESFNNAGTKANADIVQVAGALGFKPVPVRMNNTIHSLFGKFRRQIGYYKDWGNVEKVVPDEAVVLLQHPFHHKQLTREKCLRKLKKRNVKFLSIVHDVEELRGFRYSGYYQHEFETMLDLADVLIVHNDKMKHWFIEKGVQEKKLVTLKIFDYLQEKNTLEETKPLEKKYSKSLTVAGNLDTTKCGYIAELWKLKEVNINLYGANYEEKLRQYQNIFYYGEFPMDVIPSKLVEGFGLVWDGNSIDGCKGQAGQYLRYNNPHKLSLYLSSGLPVVIWSGAAEAELVHNLHLGICVDNLYEMENIFKKMTASEYTELCQNVNRVSEDLRSGLYARKALTEALNRI